MLKFDGVSISSINKEFVLCEFFLLPKAHKFPFLYTHDKFSSPFTLVYLDLWTSSQLSQTSS